MMNKFIVASLFMTSVLITPTVAKSAIVNRSFNVNIETGSLQGNNLEGFFKYDDSSLTGIGFESIGNGIGFFEFEFEWFGVTYTQDSNPGFAARAAFNNGNFLGVRYFLGWEQPTPNFSLSLSSFAYEDTEDILDGTGSISYNSTSTPESSSPTVILGFGILFLGSFLTNKLI